MLRPFQQFFAIQASGGLLLLAATVIALVWANSPWGASYVSFWQIELRLGIGPFELAHPLVFWINDGLMAIFFFVIGLEIKRELLVGELASWRQASLPIAAAAGGIAVPALLYLAVNTTGDAARGWGVPMATDTAFALGILALLGTRVPLTLKVFLTALAIIDDIGALTVIAVFYTDTIAWPALALTLLLLGILAIANAVGLRHPVVYGGLGVALWGSVLASGVHPTLAGILLALMIPAWSRISPSQFVADSRAGLRRFEAAGEPAQSMLANAGSQDSFLALGDIANRAATPLQQLEHHLHPVATFAIMPLFALANAGLRLGGGAIADARHPIAYGIMLGLVLGKPAGIVIASWVATRSGLSVLPQGLRHRHLVGIGALAGIGFTMSLFITNLAFTDPALVLIAKIGILGASILSGIIGWTILRVGSSAVADAEDSVG